MPEFRCASGHLWLADPGENNCCPICRGSPAEIPAEGQTMFTRMSLSGQLDTPPLGSVSRFLPGPLVNLEVLEEIGRGGMGIVYRCRQRLLGRIVAVKMLLVGAEADADLVARFQREASAVAQLRHPNIVQVFEIGDSSGCPYLVLEFIPGGTLAQQIARRPLPARTAAKTVHVLALAMAHAHERGILHRDLKPGNVLVDADGTLKVTDFGLARSVTDAEAPAEPLTRTGAILGTPGYMAPEQASGVTRQLGPACDIWALGAILYECLTGRPPFLAESPLETLLITLHQDPVSPRRLQPGVPRELDTIALKCLHKTPARRYASALALAEDLERYLDGRPILARPVSLIETCWKWVRRRPAVAVNLLGGLAALLAFLVGGLIYTSLVREAEREQRQARQKAEENLDLARSAVRDMLASLTQLDPHNPASVHLDQPALLRQALAYHREIIRRAGEDPLRRAEVADAARQAARITYLIGTRAEAIAAFEEAIVLTRAELELDQGDGGLLVQLARLHNSLGLCRYFANDPTGAVREYDAGLEVMKHGGQRDRLLVGQLLVNRGTVYLERKDFGQSSKNFQEAMALANPDPARPGAFEDLAARIVVNVARLEREVGGKAQGVEKAYQNSVDLIQAAQLRVGRTPATDSLLAKVWFNLGMHLDARGEVGKSLETLTRALLLQRELVHRYPDVTEYREELALTAHKVGDHFDIHGPRMKSEPFYREAVATLDGLGRRLEGFPRLILIQTQALNNLGTFEAARSNPGEANRLLERALGQARKLVASHPGEDEYQDILIRLLNNLGTRFRDRRQWEPARQYLAEADQWSRARLARLDTVPGRTLGLKVQRNLVVLDLMSGQHDRAIDGLTRVIQQGEHLLRQGGDDAELRVQLGGDYLNLGNQIRPRSPRIALPWYDRAIHVLLPQPDSGVSARQHLGLAYWGRAQAYHLLGEHALAQVNWQRALPLADPNARIWIRLGQALTRAHLGTSDAPEELAGIVKERPQSGEVAYRAALVHLVSNRPGPAFVLLERAARLGYFQTPQGLAELQSSKDLALARSDPRFQKLRQLPGVQSP